MLKRFVQARILSTFSTLCILSDLIKGNELHSHLPFSKPLSNYVPSNETKSLLWNGSIIPSTILNNYLMIHSNIKQPNLHIIHNNNSFLLFAFT
jgi:hypothetical protein